MAILDALRAFITNTSAPVGDTAMFEDGDYRLATVALLVHVANVDGLIDAAERQRLRDIIESRFGLDGSTTTRLIERAEQSDREAVDFFHFTTVLKRVLDDDGRRKIIEMMWDVVFADGSVSEFEENVVWRVAELLGVPTRDRVLLRRKVADEPRSDASHAENSRADHPVDDGPWSAVPTKQV